MTFHEQRTQWARLFRRPSFRFLFAGMFISLFGTGLNYAGVTWWVLEQTHSTVEVSFIVILVTLPGLFVPLFGGVLIDRVDRRYLGIALDLIRGVVVLGVALLAWFGAVELWHVRALMFVLGIGFAIYWSTTNSLVQEVVEPEQLMGANAAVLIAVQGGMMAAGALVGFVYTWLGLGGILAVDGLTYLAAALCLLGLRRGHHPPTRREAEISPTIEAPLPTELTEEAVVPPIVEPGLILGFLSDLREGWRYLRSEPRVLAIGLTYACMMAGVLSANVLLVALAHDLLQAGPHGYGYLEAGWAFGAISGGLLSGVLVRRFSPMAVLSTALATLAIGHALFPYVSVLAAAVMLNAVFGGCRALGGVLTQSSIMAIVPRRLMGRTQSAFSVISTLLQMAMSFSLGWLAKYVGLPIAFGALGALYGVAFLASLRARALMRMPVAGLRLG
ncbi:MAG: MFS transporter [Acidobacteriia bacterium]|jgi:MFS family permease|nr:MFS transporter [Terriglobia bacterium]